MRGFHRVSPRVRREDQPAAFTRAEVSASVLTAGRNGPPRAGAHPGAIAAPAQTDPAAVYEDLAGAYEHYKICTEYYNNNPLFWCGLGSLYYKNDQGEDAIGAFRRALALKSEVAWAWLNIGLIFEQQGNIG